MIKISILRKQQGLSQRELAKKSGISYALLSAIESGNRSLTFQTAIKLAKVLKVEPKVLMEVEFNENNNLRNLTLYKYKIWDGIDSYKIKELKKDDYILFPISKKSLESINFLQVSPLNLLIIVGDGMYPTLKGNDIVLLDTSELSFNIMGGIYAFEYKGKTYINRVQVQQNKITVIYDNKFYKSWDIEKENEIKVLGKIKVVFSINKI